MPRGSRRSVQGALCTSHNMEVSLTGLRAFVFVMGPLVLVSYVVGIMRAESPEALWGGIKGAARTATIPFMFVAAAGFLATAYVLLFKLTGAQLEGMHWPWAEADGQGTNRLLLAYAVYLIPSALWLEATLLHLQHGSPWTQALVIVVLTLVSVGLVMLGLLGYGAVQDGVPGAWWIVAGVIAMAIQSTINDNIIWVWKFPW